MSNKMIEKLYDAAANKDGSFNEEKLEYELKKAQKKMTGKAKWNKEKFSQNEIKFHTCRMYDPCPICDKCKNKASHLYRKCANCKIPICSHTHKEIKKMIKRENFKIKISKKDLNIIKNTIKE